jgi:hypothetical protein
MKPTIPTIIPTPMHTPWFAWVGLVVFTLFLARDLLVEGVPTLLRLWATRR